MQLLACRYTIIESPQKRKSSHATFKPTQLTNHSILILYQLFKSRGGNLKKLGKMALRMTYVESEGVIFLKQMVQYPTFRGNFRDTP